MYILAGTASKLLMLADEYPYNSRTTRRDHQSDTVDHATAINLKRIYDRG
jgi:hypothetical protein